MTIRHAGGNHAVKSSGRAAIHASSSSGATKRHSTTSSGSGLRRLADLRHEQVVELVLDQVGDLGAVA